MAEGRTGAENRVYNTVRDPLHLRQQHVVFWRGRLVQYPPTYGNTVYTYRRVHDEEEVLVVINGSDESRRVNLAEELNHHTKPITLVDLASTDVGDVLSVLEIAPRDVLLLRVTDEKK